MIHRWLAFLWVPLVLSAQGSVTIGGKSYPYTANPRIWFDGPSGPITNSLKDPDGKGSDIAPKARAKSRAYDALLTVIRPHVKSCDSPAGPCADPGNDRRELFASLAALDWYMDNRQTKSWNYAIWQLNHIELVNYQFQFGCIEEEDGCGINSWIDWPSEKMLYTALAYTLMRDQMSVEERTTFARKMLNGVLDQNCVNQFQNLTGSSVSYTPGSATIAGSGFLSAGLTPGQLVHIKNSSGSSPGAFARVESIDSDNQITLQSKALTAIKVDSSVLGLGGGLSLYKLNPWTKDSCGQLWQVAHHPYNAKSVTRVKDGSKLAKGFQVNDTTIQVADPTAFNRPVPFSIYTQKDRMRVTAVDGNTLTVDRGQWSSNPGAWGSIANSWVGLLEFPRGGGITTSNPTHNLVFQKIHGYIMIALALLDDDPRAAIVLDRAVQDYQEAVPLLKQLWTGLSQGGSSSYGLGRWTVNNSAIVAALRNISLDYTDGDWMKQFAYYRLYFSLPNSRKSNVPWGQSQESLVNYNSHKWIEAFQSLYAGTDEAKYVRFWETDYADQYTTAALKSEPHPIPWHLIFSSDDDPRADFTKALPTHYAFRRTDAPSDKALGAWISRTGWNRSDDTLIAAFALGTYAGDHVVMATSNPGSYKIFKNGWALTENSPSHVSYGAGANIVQIGNGTAVNLKGASTADWQNIPIDRAAGDTDNASRWAYARINLVNAYTAAAGANRALRYLAHFKVPGKQDYLVVYDDVASNKEVEKAIRLHFDRTPTESSRMDSATLPDLVWTGPNRRLSTKVLLPASPYVETADAKFSYEYRICPSSPGGSGCEQNNGPAEFLVVHRPSTSTKDVMPPISLLTADPGWACAGIADKDPKVACFPKNGTQPPSLTFTSGYQGDGQILITGLPAGKFAVTRNGTPVGTFMVNPAEGTIYLEGPSGNYAVNPESEIATVTISPQELAFQYAYGMVAAPQQFQAFCTGPSCTIRATPGCEWLTIDPATVASAGAFSVSVSPDLLTAGTYRCSVKVTLEPDNGTERLLGINVEVKPGAAGPGVQIDTEDPPDINLGEDYSFFFQASGGSPPYIWSIDFGELPSGITLSDAGELFGICWVVQEAHITVSVRDTAATPAIATQDFTIRVITPPQ